MITSTKMLADIERLQTLPVSFATIYTLATDKESTMDDLVEALKPDPALTSNILRMANTPFFGCQRQVTSINQALMILGTKKVIKIAVGGAFSRAIPQVLPGYGINASAFWCHCIAVAVLSEIMTDKLETTDKDAAFVSGLLHDIGKLVTSSWLADETDKVVDSISHSCPLVNTEKDLFDMDHTEVGAAVAEKWGLPEIIAVVSRLHHTPREEHHPLVDVVHIADCLAHSLGYGADIGELSREIDAGAMARTGLTPPVLELFASEAIGHIESMSDLYEESSGETDGV